MYYCEPCNYKTEYSSNYCSHKKTKKHILLVEQKSKELPKTIAHIPHSYHLLSSQLPVVTTKLPLFTKTIAETIVDEKSQKDEVQEILICEFCNNKFNHKSNLSRHKKSCKLKNNDSEVINNLKVKLELTEKEKEMFKKLDEEKSVILKEKNELIKEKTELLNNFMNNANTLLNKAQDNNKIATQVIQNVSMSALKYANEKFKDAPVLLPLENFNINDLDFNNVDDRKQLVDTLMYNARQKSLDKLLGDHIVKNYKKANPKQQAFHTTDCSRLNYIVKELFENVNKWEVDKNGIKICSSIIKPLIEKCIGLLLDHQKDLLDEMTTGNYKQKESVQTIINVVMSIDKGTLENDVNKYIAPFFNLSKKS
jgi:hypothetical protein